MSFLYNPEKKKAQPWVVGFFILIPVILVLGVVLLAMHKAAQLPPEDPDMTIFERLEKEENANK